MKKGFSPIIVPKSDHSVKTDSKKVKLNVVIPPSGTDFNISIEKLEDGTPLITESHYDTKNGNYIRKKYIA